MNASTVLTSGVGAPARTAIPIAERARSTRLPGDHRAVLDESVQRVVGHDHDVHGLAALKPVLDGVAVRCWSSRRSRCGVPGGAFERRGRRSMSAAVKAPEVMTLDVVGVPCPAEREG